MQKESLEDIDLSDIYDGGDPNIRSLVRAVRSLGLPTLGSCQGGLDGEHPVKHPYVTIPGLALMDNAQKIINKLLVKFNERSDIGWRTYSSAILPKKTASNPKELAILQESADELARFLFSQKNRVAR